MLSYRNQFDHPLLDRHLIRPWLDRLGSSTITRQAASGCREAQYQQLLQQTDPNSNFERVVLAEIDRRGLKLPDAAQELIPEANSKPDFIYRNAKVAIFCDGSVHDRPEQQEQDRIERDNLRYTAGYYVLTLRHDEDWQAQLEILASLL